MDSSKGTTTLWTLQDWRCEVSPAGLLTLYRNSELIASHNAPSAVRAMPYADAWRAAISDLVGFAGSSRPDAVSQSR